jgi:hypothetical protein
MWGKLVTDVPFLPLIFESLCHINNTGFWHVTLCSLINIDASVFDEPAVSVPRVEE